MGRCLFKMFNDAARKLSGTLLKECLVKEFGFVNQELLVMYMKAVSVHQTSMLKHGKRFEQFCENILKEKGIPFSSQVPVDRSGNITMGNRSRLNHVFDIVVGNVVNGDNIRNYSVVSCKTTCRERWTQDEKWSLTNPPRVYVLATLSDDYPRTDRFAESDRRYIVTCKPRIRDDRIYKKSFDDLEHILSW